MKGRVCCVCAVDAVVEGMKHGNGKLPYVPILSTKGVDKAVFKLEAARLRLARA